MPLHDRLHGNLGTLEGQQCLRQVGVWVMVGLGTIIGQAVVPPVWAGLFTALESFMPGHGAQLTQQACDPEQQACFQDE